MTTKLLLASNNRHKQREIQQIIDEVIPGLVKIITPNELGIELDVIEDGSTLRENASKKAQEFFDASSVPSIADDTGLEIDALDGAPGVFSARYAGRHCNDSDNRKKVLQLMLGIVQSKRTARFRTVICFKDHSGHQYFEGICEGRILNHEIGENGFGYDQLFVPDGHSISFAQMEPETKNDISHRRKAVESFAMYLKNVIHP